MQRVAGKGIEDATPALRAQYLLCTQSELLAGLGAGTPTCARCAWRTAAPRCSRRAGTCAPAGTVLSAWTNARCAARAPTRSGCTGRRVARRWAVACNTGPSKAQRQLDLVSFVGGLWAQHASGAHNAVCTVNMHVVCFGARLEPLVPLYYIVGAPDIPRLV